MTIHPLWIVCLLVRVAIILFIRYQKLPFKIQPQTINTAMTIVLLCIGLGLLYQGTFSSNNEYQITNVFWHETRYLHGTLYLFAAYYLWNHNLPMNTVVLILDLCLSLIYRWITDK
jgi:hypothetical protein